MTGHPGAIILIVYYSLKDFGRLQTWFSAEELFSWIRQLRTDPHAKRLFTGFVSLYMKHHRKPFPLTLEEKTRLDNWLNLHVNQKHIFWFNKQNSKFRLKSEHLERLSDYMPRLGVKDEL